MFRYTKKIYLILIKGENFMKFAELKKSLLSVVMPCYFVSGDDPFLRESSCLLIERQIFGEANKNNLNKQVFSSDELDPTNFISVLNTMPFFADKKLVILKVYEPKKDTLLINLLKEYVKLPNEQTCLVIVDNTYSEAVATLKPLCTFVDCTRLDTSLLKKWILQKLSTAYPNFSASITAEAMDTLIDYTNGYLSKISLELDKLVSYSGGKIEKKHIEELVPKDLEYSIYELTNSLASGNIKNAELIKKDMMSNRKNASNILPVIHSYFRRLFLIITSDKHSTEIAKLLNIKEFAVTKNKEISKKFGAKKLRSIVELCSDLDYKIKSSQISVENANNYLLLFIFDCIK